MEEGDLAGVTGLGQLGLPYLPRAHQVPHHAAPQHCQCLVVKVRRAHAWGRSRYVGRAHFLGLQGRRQGANAKSTQGNKGALSQATTGSQGGAKS